MRMRVRDGGGLERHLSQLARPLAADEDLDPLLRRIGDARVVLLGEATHGTREFYEWRNRLALRLICEAGFSFIAVEGDWPDCFAVDRYVKDLEGAAPSARDALGAFARWPTWMWANEETLDLVDRLRGWNADRERERRAGFYGLDVYSLWDSLRAVMTYLERHDPTSLPLAQRAWRCFEPYGQEAYRYAQATAFVPASCEDDVLELLLATRRRAPATGEDPDIALDAEQNAAVALEAERYYRTMMRGDAASWNIRDRHMVNTLERLLAHHGPSAKGIVFAHNTHVGDARFTDMKRSGTVNVGQLARERYGDDAVAIVGFGTHRGEVIAADAWDAPMRRMRVPPARADSWDDLVHQLGHPSATLVFDGSVAEALADVERDQRAIGVVYAAEQERWGNYVPTVLARRYDALIHIDASSAVRPLGVRLEPDRDLPQTYPTKV